jgi:hypothetical protein
MEDDIVMVSYTKRMACYGLDSAASGQGLVEDQFESDGESSCSMKCWEILSCAGLAAAEENLSCMKLVLYVNNVHASACI